MKKSIRKTIFLIITVANFLVLAKAASFIGATSLCHQGEVEYFGCELQDSNKIASVCAADNISPDHGYVQYRFGTHGYVEYRFPGKLLPPRGKISIVDVSRLPDGLGSHLKFVSGRYTYVVSNALVPGEVYVEKDGKIVFDKICKGSAYKPFGNTTRRGLEYGVTDSVDGLDQHGK
ncbi:MULTISPECIES: hypothetical protein [Burkholderia]|uniref:hypothetical protein n=1 Tax=Burkholderia TaxID=32008 RepID=UPI00158C0655|nr:hypothetical protein [Burkholderia cepacia]MCA7939570.1 hypothetical protein [Burkholderia cepacia]MCA8054981.1 hypothetical protein [Burkholderia cepacia]MCA8130617.1 hypothetical protein [Burkholderia cepacia]MCA8164350.1 hypothetical protein [Burkholderia cepacia]MDN7612972.1 hypothetical protein [Burkholderia cepacia]